MRTVAAAVSQILAESDIALEAMNQGILNLSAFAEKIQPEVESITWKPVRKGTIVVALARLAADKSTYTSLRPDVKIDDLKIQSPLVDISFEKTVANLKSLSTLGDSLTKKDRSILVSTEGMSEITIIASAEYANAIRAHFTEQPKSLVTNVAGVSVGFDPKYLEVPNAIYSLLSSVASKRINILGIVSTHSELMLIVSQEELEVCVKTLQKHFPKNS